MDPYIIKKSFFNLLISFNIYNFVSSLNEPPACVINFIFEQFILLKKFIFFIKSKKSGTPFKLVTFNFVTLSKNFLSNKVKLFKIIFAPTKR